MIQNEVDRAAKVRWECARMRYHGPDTRAMFGDIKNWDDELQSFVRDIVRYLRGEIESRRATNRPYHTLDGLSFGVRSSPDSLDVFRSVRHGEPGKDPVLATFARVFSDQAEGVAKIVVREFRGSNPQSPSLLVFARDWQVEEYLRTYAEKVYAVDVREDRGRQPTQGDYRRALEDLVSLPGRFRSNEVSATELKVTLDLIQITTERLSESDRLPALNEITSAQLHRQFAAIAGSGLPPERKAELTAELRHRMTAILSEIVGTEIVNANHDAGISAIAVDLVDAKLKKTDEEIAHKRNEIKSILQRSIRSLGKIVVGSVVEGRAIAKRVDAFVTTKGFGFEIPDTGSAGHLNFQRSGKSGDFYLVKEDESSHHLSDGFTSVRLIPRPPRLPRSNSGKSTKSR